MGLFSFVGGLFAGNAQKKAASKAAAAQVEAARLGIAEQTRQYDQSRTDFMPYLNAGTGALSGMSRLLGLSGGHEQQAALAALEDSPGYLSAIRNGEEAVLQNAAATGGIRGGNTQRGLADFRSDTFADTLQRQLANLGGLAGMGMAATGSVAQLGQNKANAVTGLYDAQGDANAYKYLTRGGVNASMWNSAGDQIVGYADANGFKVDRRDVERFVRGRAASGGRVAGGVTYKRAPRVLTDPGDGTFGATMRGVGDPLNVLDELGAVVDSLGGTGGRENVQNSDRRWADIWANNVDQNRSILANDDAEHPYARFGGQLASGIAIPTASIEGVGLNAARAVLRGGGSRMAAEAAAEAAVRARLATAGAIEGSVIGAGGAEGGFVERAKGAVIGAPLGAALGYGTAALGQRVGGMWRDFRAGRAATAEAAGGVPRADVAPDLPASPRVDAAPAPVAVEPVPPVRPASVAPAEPASPPPGRPGALTGAQYVETYAAPSTVKEYVAQPPGGLGSAVIGPDGKLHMFRTDGSPMGHADEVGHYDFGYATGPDEAAGFAELTRYRGEIAVTRSANETPQQARALNELVARARREGLNIVDEQPKPVPSAAARTEWDDMLRAYDERHGPSGPWDDFAPATDGVARPAGASIRPIDPLVDPAAFPVQPRDLPPETFRGPLSDHTPIVWREMGFDSDGFGRATMPSQHAPRWRNEGGTDALMFADNPAMATGQGGNKGILFEYDAAPFIGRPQLDKPGGTLAWRNGAGEYSTNGVTQETLQSALRGFRVKPGALDAMPARDRSLFDMMARDLEAQGWQRTDLDDGGMIYRRPDANPTSADEAATAGPWDDFAPVADDVADMANEMPRATLDGPRVPDRIDLRQPRQLLGDAPDVERLAAASRMQPNDVTPLPTNTVRDLDEATSIERGRYEPVRAPNERDVLGRRNLPSPVDGSRTIPKRGPLDLVTWARTQGGLRDDGGNLAHSGIDNAPRTGMDFAGGEQRFGKLVDDANGMSLDDAALRAWEAGYFPDHAERPTVNEFLDAITGTHSGTSRRFNADDYAEVEAFEAARAQRWDVEQARFEGAPLTNDRGQPIGADDLDAITPPVRAYEEWGENAPDFAGNIRLGNLDSPQAIKRALLRTEQVTGGFDAARRGRITQAETKALAEDLGMTADDLLKRRKGEAFNAEEALAARQILARSATDLVNMAKRIARTHNPGDEAEAAFREAWLRHAAIQEQVSGMTAEAGRLLQQFRMTADSRDATQALSSVGDILGGSGRLKDVASRIVDLEEAGTTAAGVNRFSLRALSPKWRDKATELYINSLLSGPQTHAVNFLSNTLTTLAQVPEHMAAALLGNARRVIANPAATDRVLMSEAGARTVGMIAGAKEGIRAAARSFMTGESSDAITKIETQQMKAIGGPLGSIIRTPTRALTASDEFFKAVARRMEMSGEALRRARAEGLKGKAARDRAADLVLNPPDDMLRKAFEYARYVTFQTPLDHNSLGGGLSRATQEFPALKLLVPFVRTPVNLLRFAAERSPAAVLMKTWRADFMAGGARRDLAVARMMLGSGMGAAMYEMALAGHITGGGPADPQARKLMEADGWQPYSLRVGDKYYSYQRFDPFSTTIGTVADMVELSSHMTERQKEESGKLVTASIINNLGNKTWLSGISSGLEAISDPTRYLDSFIARTAGAIAVPSFVNQMARVNDPTLREARGTLDRIRSRVPGLSETLPPRRDVFGNPLQSEGGVGPDILSPIWRRTAKNDPTIKALLADEIGISEPSRSYVSGGKRLDWTPAQYSELKRLTGEYAKPQLDALVRGPGWAALSLSDREDAVRDLMKDARAEAKGVVLREGPPGSGGPIPPPPPGFSLEGIPPPPPGFTVAR